MMYPFRALAYGKPVTVVSVFTQQSIERHYSDAMIMFRDVAVCIHDDGSVEVVPVDGGISEAKSPFYEDEPVKLAQFDKV